MKKGFTLIELLAVIVILAIIATIATPIVLSIINDAKESATLRGAEFYIKGLEQSVATSSLKDEGVEDGTYNILENGDVCLKYDTDSKCINKLEVKVKGEKPKGGSITIAAGVIIDANLTLDNNTVLMNPEGELVMGGTSSYIELNHSGIIPEGGTYITVDGTEYTEGDAFPETVNVGDTYRYGNYEYCYGYVWCRDCETWEAPDEHCFDMKSTGWDVYCVNDVAEPGEIISIINVENVTSMAYTFYDKKNLTIAPIIPNSVTSIGREIFFNCDSLTSIKVSGNNPIYDSRNDSNAIIETATNTLMVGSENTVIPNSVTSIGEGAFAGCDGLTTITIPSSVTSIGDNAFFGCSSLTSIIIPVGVTSIGQFAFNYCSSLMSIKVDSDNKIYDSRNDSNAIIETVSNTLLYGSNNTTIPSSVTSIDTDAFHGRSKLTNIIIPSSVTNIGQFAFRDCNSLTNIIIPASVTSIGSSAFSECSSLTTINYTGTQTQWNAISKGNYWDNGTPSNKVINYNYAG